MGGEKICVRGTIITLAASSDSDEPVAEVVLLVPLEEACALASMLYIPAVLEISPEPQPEPRPGKPRLRTVR